MARDRQWVVLDPTLTANKAREPAARELAENGGDRKHARGRAAPDASDAGDKPER